MIGMVLWKGKEWEVECLDDGSISTVGGTIIPVGEAVFLPPVSPTKIVCVGRNYAEHARELGNPLPERPLLFLKPPSSLLAHGGTIILPSDSNRVDYEGEIGVVISRTCHGLSSGSDARRFIMGVTPLLDITARDLQKLDVQFTRAKSFDTFCPVGPWINTAPEMESLGVKTILNEKVVQDGRASDMVFSIENLVAYISRIMTLERGDIIATGTPSGVGSLSEGDAISAETAGVRLSCIAGSRK